ncbi:MAG: DNA-formamidopyrimidine glycosylase family protein [Fuerstiella sp.]
MPEGDTIFVAASNLAKVLQSQEIAFAAADNATGIRATAWRGLQRVSDLTGQTVTSVWSKGKHLLMEFCSGAILHSHMGMTGSWHIYRPDDVWQKPSKFAAVQMRTKRWCVVCFSPKMIELVTAGTLKRDPYFRRLGPDLLQEEIPDAQFVARFRTQDSTTIGEAVMNQTVVSGIGNVYKSEVLFCEHLNPKTLVSQLSHHQLLGIRDMSVKLMKRNLRNAPRQTRFAADSQKLWVYGRQDQPCFVCGQDIQMMRQGELGRSTYFCPRCQPKVGAPV